MSTPAPKLPADVVISGRVWELEVRDGLNLDEERAGLTQFSRGRIVLDTDAAQPRTMLHELMHAAEETLESDIPHDTIAALAAGLADALISRPVLAEWIAARARGDV
jgi:hypothetical protein